MFTKIIKFSLIGLANTSVHWSIFMLLYNITTYQSISNLCGFLCAATFSFYMNATYTFEATKSLQRYILFMIFMALFNYAIGFVSDTFNMYPLYALIISSALGFAINFFFMNKFIFKEQT